MATARPRLCLWKRRRRMPERVGQRRRRRQGWQAGSNRYTWSVLLHDDTRELRTMTVQRGWANTMCKVSRLLFLIQAAFMSTVQPVLVLHSILQCLRATWRYAEMFGLFAVPHPVCLSFLGGLWAPMSTLRDWCAVFRTMRAMTV